MEVVLKQDYDQLGKAMEVVNVRDGYARNYLIPQGIAVHATKGNMKAVAEARKMQERREEKRIKEARQLAKQVEKVPCTLEVEVGEEDKIFGSVSAQDIAEFLKKEGFDVAKNAVELEEPIRKIGVYNIQINLYKDIGATLKVWVVKKEK